MELYDIANAMQERPKFGALDMNKRHAGLTAIIARLYSLKGMGGAAVVQTNDGRTEASADVRLAVLELEKECAQKYPFFSMSEIRLALESGVKGELSDDATYLNVANFCKWLAVYRKSPARLEAAQAVENRQRIAEPVRQLDAGTVESRNDAACQALFDTLLQEVRTTGTLGAGHLSPVVASVYDWLRAKGRMEKPSPAEIQAAMKTAAGQAQGKASTAADAVRLATASVVGGAKRILLTNYLRTL